jgi:hypothetical protein
MQYNECPHCRYPNPPRAEACRGCGGWLTPRGSAAPRLVHHTQPLSPAARRRLGLAAAGIVVAFVALVAWFGVNLPRWQAERRAEFEAKVEAGKGAIRQGDLAGGERLLRDALAYHGRNKHLLEGTPANEASGLADQCRLALNERKVEDAILSMTDKEFREYSSTGRAGAKAYFDDPDVNEYFVNALAARRPEAARMRADEAKREAEARKQQEIAAKEARQTEQRRERETRSAMIDARAAYADELERLYLDKGMDVYVTVSGPDKTVIKLEYVLMSRPLVHQMSNDDSVMTVLRSLGFKKLVLSDKYDSSWTVSL